jgi:hypothetical protein
VTELKQVTPQRFAAWQAEAEQLLDMDSQTSATEE